MKPVTHPRDAVRGTRHDDVHRIPLVGLREGHAQDLLHAIGPPHAGVHVGQLVAVYTPDVQPGGGARRYVPGQVVDRHGRYGAGVAPQLSHEHAPRQVPDDGGAVPRSGHDDVVGRTGGQARDSVRVGVQAVLYAQGLLSRLVLPNGHNLR